jgi:hypothetical protein
MQRRDGRYSETPKEANAELQKKSLDDGDALLIMIEG